MKNQSNHSKINIILDLISEIVLETDKNQNIIFVDPKVTKISGYDPMEMIGQKIFDFVSESSYDPLRKAFASSVEKNAPSTNVLTTIVRKDGTLLPAASSLAPILGSDKQLEAFIIVGKSIADDLENQSKILQHHMMYQAVVEAQTELICRQLADGTLTFVNNAYCSYFNISHEELLGTSYYNFIPQEDQSMIRQSFIGLTARQPYITIEHRCFNKLGQLRHHQWMHRAFFRSDGSFIEIQSSGRDITDQKCAEERVLIFKTMADVANYGIAIADLKGDLIYANPHFIKMYGVQNQKDNNDILSFYFPDQAKDIKIVIERLLEEENLNALEMTNKSKDGTHHPVLMNGVLIRNAKGIPCFVAISVIDLTEKKETEELIRQKSQDLAIRNKQLSEMNNTLKVLLDQRSKDREEMEMTIISNLRELVFPLLQELRKIDLSPEHSATLNLLESSLLKLLSPYLRHIKHRFPSLTNKELQVLTLIRDGLGTKEISDFMGTSLAAINLHRYNIRQKLGLNKSKLALADFLLSADIDPI